MKSLRSQLLLQVFMPLALVGSLAVWASFNTVEGLIEHRLEKEIELVARALRLPIQRALVEQDLGRIEQTLAAVFDISQVYGAYVYDAEGRRIATAGERRPGWQEQIEAAEVVALGQELGRYAELAGEEVYSYFIPLTGPTGRIEGLFQVVRLESEIAQRLDSIKARAWLAWTAVILLVLGILLFGHRRAVHDPVEALLASMRTVEGGDAGHRTAVQGPREMVALASGLNRMLDGLEQMQSQLDHQRERERRMHDRLREQESLATLGRFSSGVAHELGAPLTVIDGDARRLESLAGSDPDAARRLRRIRGQVDRTRQLIRQLMEFVRSDTQQTVPVPMERLLSKVLAGVSPQAEASSITLEMPTLDDGLILQGYEVRLEHALLNLARNAVQAARTRVRLTAGRGKGGLWLAVEDDGPGIPEDARTRIFQPFESSRDEGEGTGLGLAIVQSVAREHGASIHVGRSDELGGSRFELRFGESCE
ncbi:MAG: ATP-binding protein [Wenzhouxiangella sp.]